MTLQPVTCSSTPFPWNEGTAYHCHAGPYRVLQIRPTGIGERPKVVSYDMLGGQLDNFNPGET